MKPFYCADCGAELNPWEKVFLWDSRRGETCWICEDCFGDHRREQSNEEFAALIGSEVCIVEDLLNIDISING